MSNRTREILELVKHQNQINVFNSNCLINDPYEEIAINNKTDTLDKTKCTNVITETVLASENGNVFKDPDPTMMFANLENMDICYEMHDIETPVAPPINIQELDIVFLDNTKTDNANCEIVSNLFFTAEDMIAILLNSQPILTANEIEQEQSEENRNKQEKSEENRNEQGQSEENKNEQDQSDKNRNKQEQR